jgi:hypothetical protein
MSSSQGSSSSAEFLFSSFGAPVWSAKVSSVVAASSSKKRIMSNGLYHCGSGKKLFAFEKNI